MYNTEEETTNGKPCYNLIGWLENQPNRLVLAGAWGAAGGVGSLAGGKLAGQPSHSRSAKQGASARHDNEEAMWDVMCAIDRKVRG